MKVIFLKDVAGVARRNDIKDVTDGYALNMLIPRGIAEVASGNAVKRVAETKAREEAEKQAAQAEIIKACKAIEGKVVLIEEKANEKGHLFSGVTAERITSAIKASFGVHLPASHIELSKPLKEVGVHTLKVMMGPAGKSTSVQVEIKGK